MKTQRAVRPWRGAKILAAASAVTVIGEAAYAVLRKVPFQPEFDASGVFGSPYDPPFSIAVIGDSSCTGPGVTAASEIWCQLIGQLVADRGRRVTIKSFATGGATSATALADQVPRAEAWAGQMVDVERSGPIKVFDMAFIAVGTNDVIHQTKLKTLEHNLEQIIQRLNAVSHKVVVAGIGDLGTVPRLKPPLRQWATRRGWRADIVQARVAGRHGAVKANLWGAAAETFRSNRAIFSPDLFHPGPTGHLAWADAAWEAVEPHLDT